MARKDRKRRRNGYVAFGNALLMIVVLAMVGGAAVLYWGWQTITEPGPAEVATKFLVERNSGLNTVASRLQEQGLISSQLLFSTLGKIGGKEKSFKPGEWEIPARASIAQILKQLTEEKGTEFAIVVTPGQSSYEVADYINHDAKLRLTGDAVDPPPEGAIMPVNYEYLPNDTRADVLKKMVDKMTAAVDAAWASCKPDICGAEALLKSKQDFVTMASIVEKEAGNKAEMPTVAGLYLNRLRTKGWRLQSDATILYGLYKGVPQSELEISQAEKDERNNYNTYQIDGLPPGPIANPGEDAMAAVANPADTNFFYMMAKTPCVTLDGHNFAGENEDDKHKQNIAAYYAQVDQLKAKLIEAGLAKRGDPLDCGLLK